ncbi:MAG: ABC transporter substrate-binding protein [Frankiaceae bacterium]
MLRPRGTAAVAAAGGMTFALLVTACGGSSGGQLSSNPSSSGGTSLSSLVPADIKSDGTITIGVDATYAPSEFLASNGKTVEGFDVDLFDAVAQQLGLKTKWVPAPFANIIPGVVSGKYEIGVSSFTINADRLKVTHMVSYFKAGTQWATQKGNPRGIQPDSACGHKIAVQRGTTQADDDLPPRSKKCTDAGQPAIHVDQYQGQDQATSAVVSGKDDAELADSPVIAYAVQQTEGHLELLGDIYDSAPYGYAVRKSNTELATAIQKALAALIKNGTYKKVLDKWGVSQGAITNPQVDPPVS